MELIFAVSLDAIGHRLLTAIYCPQGSLAAFKELTVL